MTETYLITMARYVRADSEPELEELSNLLEQGLMSQGCQIIGAGDAGVPELLAENHTALCRLTFRDDKGSGESLLDARTNLEPK